MQAFSVIRLLYITLAITLFSCSGYQKLLKDGTPQEKLEAAKKYYQKEDFVRSQMLLEELLGLYYGKPEREEIYYLYAYSYYGTSEFLLAGYHFNSFALTYTLSPKREEAAYMAAVCQFKKAMPVELDQTPTQSAISTLQTFINQYPNSKYVSECNDKIDILRGRILAKVYENAKLYHSLGYYNSAMVACENAVEDYPDMVNRDELSYLSVDAAYMYAKNSITKRQLERYTDARSRANNYLKEFGQEAEFSKEVNRIITKSNSAIAEINIVQEG